MRLAVSRTSVVINFGATSFDCNFGEMRARICRKESYRDFLWFDQGLTGFELV